MRNQRGRMIGNDGFSLPEVLLAAAIFATALVALLSCYVAFTILNENTRNLSTAVNHAQYVLEDIKDSDFDDMEDNITNQVWDWDSQEITGQGLTSIRNESIDARINSAATDPLDVSVIVSWNNRLGSGQQIELRTLFTENGNP